MNKSEYVLRLAHDKGYKCDDMGVVTSAMGNILTPMINKEGYKVISICTKTHKDINHSSYPLKVHRLQAYQKFGDKIFDKGIQVRHLNNIKNDNSFENIEIGTPSQNQLDNPKELNHRRAKFASDKALEKNIKFTDDLIREIGEFVHRGDNLLKDAIIKYDISASSLSRVMRKYRSVYGMEKTEDMIRNSKKSLASKSRKFNDKQVEEIRTMRKNGAKIKDIKEKFNISNGSIWYIMTKNYISSK